MNARWVCPNCGSNNMPQMAACFRCGAAPAPVYRQPTYTPPQAGPPQPSPHYPPPPYPPHYYGPGPYASPPRQSPDAIYIPPGQHSVSTAVLLALLIGGWAAALYNRQYLKGVVCLLISILLAAVTGCVALIVIVPASIADGILIAQRLNRGEAVGQWQFF